jgi:protein-disulfide isomerase
VVRREIVETTLTGLIAASALVIAGILVRRELGRSEAPSDRAQSLSPVRFAESIAAARIPLGGGSGAVQITEFIDFECPFCRRLDSTLRRFDSLYPGAVSRWIVHYPIPSHRFALPAARAAECAAEQEAFAEMHRVLFAKQDSLGLKSWGSYAAEAGVRDTVRLLTCIAEPNGLPRIEAGRAAGEREGVSATPTVIVNQWRLGRPPTEDELALMVADARAGRKPLARVQGEVRKAQ